MKKETLYPLKFKPILKEKVWGGNKLQDQLGKTGPRNIGESWELSGVEGSISLVINGELQGLSINELIAQYQENLVGEKVFDQYGKEFPLLFKFIDAHQDLSVQLHPNDELAKIRHNSFGKTEMWYILDADPDARLIIGFNQDMEQNLYLRHLSEETITDILKSETIKTGDSFFIATGTIHAIGAGTLLAEIQQTSDITYRIYDWDRPDSNGEMRELHNDLALEAINYDPIEAKLNYEDTMDERIRLCRSDYFETNKLNLTKPMLLSLAQIDSFVVYMCVDGEANIVCYGESISITRGETVLIPAMMDSVEINTATATLLEVYIP